MRRSGFSSCANCRTWRANGGAASHSTLCRCWRMRRNHPPERRGAASLMPQCDDRVHLWWCVAQERSWPLRIAICQIRLSKRLKFFRRPILSGVRSRVRRSMSRSTNEMARFLKIYRPGKIVQYCTILAFGLWYVSGTEAGKRRSSCFCGLKKLIESLA